MKKSVFISSFLITILILSIIITPSFFLTTLILKSDKEFPSSGIQTSFTPTSGYKSRQQEYLKSTVNNTSFYANVGRVYQGIEVEEDSFENVFDYMSSRHDCADFRVNSLLRIMYFNKQANVLSVDLLDRIKQALLDFKYFYTEPNDDEMIFWTENHQILFHTCELLVGQLYPTEIFTNSGMTGLEHKVLAEQRILRWLGWKGQMGFMEWHSATYYTEDLAPLVNLVDFAENQEIATKAAMVLDLIAFDFANNYFDGRFATTMGRIYESTRIGTGIDDKPGRESTSESAYIMLGHGYHNPKDGGNMAAVALATSEKYSPPRILEDIAQNAQLYHEHKERSSIVVDDADQYGIGYTTSEHDMMFWWSTQAQVHPKVVESTMANVANYGLDSNIVYGPSFVQNFLRGGGNLHGVTMSEYCDMIRAFSQGIALESVSTYTYRTPYYQLSGAQDYQKGMNSMQEHVWQATLDENTIIFTNCPEAVTKDFQTWVGGWKPKATFYRNVGVIQYDRDSMPLEAELAIGTLDLALGGRFYTHAYFPQWAFDEVEFRGSWIFGSKDGGFIAFYVYEPSFWLDDYELRTLSRKNLYVVEMGSIQEYASFNEFISTILGASLIITPEGKGYDVQYSSPSQGVISVSWDDPLIVDGNEIDIGPYPRYDNQYCFQEFGTNTTIIQYGAQKLELNFNAGTRIYTQ